MSTITEADSRPIDTRGKLWWAAPLAGIAAAILNSIIFVIASSLGAIPSTVLVPGVNMPITIVAVIINSFVSALVGGIVLAVLNRFTKQPVRIFRILGVIVLVLSFVQPFLIPNVPLAMALTLDLMHIVAAATIIGILTTIPVRR